MTGSAVQRKTNLSLTAAHPGWVRDGHWPGYLFYRTDRKQFVVTNDVFVDEEMFSDCVCATGRNNAPALLIDLIDAGAIDLSESPRIVGTTWSTNEFPESSAARGVWVDLFRWAGYTHEGTPAFVPTEGLTVYRGATADRRFGMAWTADIGIARRFAYGGLSARPRGAVFVAAVEPDGLLAYLGSEGRGEAEYVVDPKYLSDENVRMLEDNNFGDRMALDALGQPRRAEL